jgi:hypothetical protein
MRLHLVTCTDWNYRRWTTTLINSLDDSWTEKFVIAVGEGDWEAYGAQLGVTIIPQQFNHAMDPIRWCQNVRMRHLRALIENCDWLLQVDSDVRQNLNFNIKHIYGLHPKQKNKEFRDIFFANIKQIGKRIGNQYEKVDPRFRINAGWCLYKNCSENKKKLLQIQQAFDHTYNDEENWDQLQLFKHYESAVDKLPWKYVDEGIHGWYPWAGWYHCKGPGRKNKDNKFHDLHNTPIPHMTSKLYNMVLDHKWLCHLKRTYERY